MIFEVSLSTLTNFWLFGIEMNVVGVFIYLLALFISGVRSSSKDISIYENFLNNREDFIRQTTSPRRKTIKFFVEILFPMYIFITSLVFGFYSLVFRGANGLMRGKQAVDRISIIPPMKYTIALKKKENK